MPQSTPQSSPQSMPQSAPQRHTAPLLPQGLRDLLPPDAAHEAFLLAELMAMFNAAGYETVKPPLMENESSLCPHPEADSHNVFRLTDPASRHMVALRSDLTPQVARIARTRLASHPRPLRLAYCGEALCTHGNLLHPERQYVQAGIELFGAPGGQADLEVILLGVEVLRHLGVKDLTVDLNSPTLTNTLFAHYQLGEQQIAQLRRSLNRKDLPAINASGGAAAPLLIRLEEASGPMPQALDALAAAKLPAAAAKLMKTLLDLAAALASQAADVAVTLDPLENRGLAYHSGVTFSFFTRGYKSELGRGGRYHSGGSQLPMQRLLARSQKAGRPPVRAADGGGEQSTGFTIFVEALRACCRQPPARRRLYAAADASYERVQQLRRQGWVVIRQLERSEKPRSEARRLGCRYILEGERIAELTEADATA